ncbi:Gfo/Idh/MocA family oxidoreductase [Luteitalea sp.]|uniref:Gfo/Idh/MocA family protein n=1 Tax=Luteitalea sp. TaxID=2004800 RepID=UPI0025BF0196|nr:Gfo/Idh/MocA family oxidoreductase [Luteitalea sp.]
MSDQNSTAPQGLPRREFVRAAGMAAAGLTIVPRHVLGKGQTAPSDLVNVAGVGVGGMGRSNMTNLASQNIVALCDVDWGFAGKAYDGIPQQVAAAEKRLAEATPAPTPEQRQRAQAQIESLKQLAAKAGKATRYVDYREMLEKQKDIDAVMIATPDHTHAVIATAAMSLGKHVYVQKPLAWSVEECRALAKKAIDTKVVTQMGNQGHSSDDARLVNEYIQSGTIGDVREVHIWTNRPLAYWPQGIPRPEPSKMTASPDASQPWNLRFVMDKLAGTMQAAPHAVPDKLAWDLFLGPAPQIEYHPVYHPFNWRGWTDWGVGAIGDMGAHLIDHAVWALDLGYPTSVETQSTPYNKATYPMATTTYYEFPARGAKPAVKVTWFDGGLLPPKPEEMGTEEFDKGGGVLYIGSKGKLLHGTYAQNPRLLGPLANAPKPPQTYKRITTSHEINWIDAIRGRQETTSPFSYAAKLTEIMLLGVVALNAGKKIQYDGATMKITNAPEAEQFLRRQYRQGWALA